MNLKTPEKNIKYCFRSHNSKTNIESINYFSFSHVDEKGYYVFWNLKYDTITKMTLKRFNFLLRYNLVAKTILKKEDEKTEQEEKSNQTTETNTQIKKNYTEQDGKKYKEFLNQIITELSSYVNKKEQIKLQFEIDIENLIKDFKSYLKIPINSDIDPKFNQIMTDYIKISTKYQKVG